MSDKHALIYIGKGRGTLIGVPARNLTYEEAKKFGITGLLASGLYVYNAQKEIPSKLYPDLNIGRRKKKKENDT